MPIHEFNFKICRTSGWVFFCLLMAFALGCESKEDKKEPSPAQLQQAKLYDRGRSVYFSRCIACHHSDPKKDGAIGPAVWGSSLELLRARVIYGNYPAGYKPKRPTQVMVALPHLKNDVDALHEYLNSSQP